MSQSIDDLKAAVEASVTVQESAIVLINGIADRIAQAGVDPVALQAVVDSLKAESTKLSDAVVANTPSA